MPTQQEPIVLDGAHGEGGGALLRSAVAMSCLTLQALHLHSVRKGLRKPGLTSEDLTFVEILGDATRADVEGAGVGSNELVFAPRCLAKPVSGRYEVHLHEKGKVPGNALIVLTGVLPVLARTGGYSELSVCAETHNEKTVAYDAFERVTLAAMREFGLYAFPRLLEPGFGFGAKGEVAVEIEPSALRPVEWPDRGEVRQVSACVSVGDLPEKLGETACSSLKQLARRRGLEIECEAVQHASRSKGATVTVWAEFERGIGSGTAALGKDGSIEEAAALAFHRFCEWFDSDATVDPYLADQLLLVAIQAEGRTVLTTSALTKRLITMAWVVRQFMPVHVTVLGREGEPGTVTIER